MSVIGAEVAMVCAKAACDPADTATTRRIFDFIETEMGTPTPNPDLQESFARAGGTAGPVLYSSVSHQPSQNLMISSESLSFLKKLLDTPGPSGFEAAPAKVWREHAGQFAKVSGDVAGNSLAEVNGGGK